MRIASALLALLLTLPLTGWLLLPAIRAAGSASAPSAADACARACTMQGMKGMAGKACPMMQQARRNQACSCQISGLPHRLALDPVHAIAPELPASHFSFGRVTARVSILIAAFPLAGHPGAIDHPPSRFC